MRRLTMCVVFALVAACGGGGGPPADPFSITSDLNGMIYVYHLPNGITSGINFQYPGDADVAVTYEPASQLVLALWYRADILNGVFGPAIGDDIFTPTVGAFDFNNNDDILDDEPRIVVIRTPGTFSSDGGEMEIDIAIDLDGLPINVRGTGTLTRTQPVGAARLADGMRAALGAH